MLQQTLKRCCSPRSDEGQVEVFHRLRPEVQLEDRLQVPEAMRVKNVLLVILDGKNVLNNNPYRSFGIGRMADLYHKVSPTGLRYRLRQ